MLLATEETPWEDYIDPRKPTDEDGNAQLRDDAPSDVVEAYRLYVRQLKNFL